MFIDTHCHLNRLDLQAYDQQVDLALDAARAQRVHQFLTISVDLDEYDELMAIASRHDDIGMSVGVHPCEQIDMLKRATVETLCALADHPKVWAIGETGFDYHYSSELAQAQKQSFIHHIHASKLLGKPLVVHTREAREPTIDILRAEQVSHGILHCFTEDYATAKAAIDLGMYVSFSGIISFKNAQALRDVATQLPLDRLLIETDSPYLAPMPYRGKSNEPKYLPHVAHALATALNMSPEKLAEQTCHNFSSLLSAAAASVQKVS